VKSRSRLAAAISTIVIAALLAGTPKDQQAPDPIEFEEVSPIIARSTAPSSAIPATIYIDTNAEQPIQAGFSGYNYPALFSTGPVAYKPYVQAVNELHPGVLRWPAGTPNDAYNWRAGDLEDEWTVQFNERNYLRAMKWRSRPRVLGTAKISDYKRLLDQIQAKSIIVVNAANDTPSSIYDLAKYCADNNIIVEYWEIGNENYYHSEFYNDGRDYALKARPFAEAIRSAVPGAKIVLTAMTEENEKSRQWNADMTSVPKYWDGVVFHSYKGNGPTIKTAMEALNYAAAFLSKPGINDQLKIFGEEQLDVISTEFNIGLDFSGTTVQNPLQGSIYAGIYNAEIVNRFISDPKYRYMTNHSLNKQVLPIGTLSGIDSAFRKGLTLDYEGSGISYYISAEAKALTVSNEAINRSLAIWKTTVQGGTRVAAKGGVEIPALYAQAYRGADDKNYLVVTNKSGAIHSAILSVIGSASPRTVLVSAASSLDPSAINTATSPNQVEIHTAASANPVTIPPYSVVRIEWEKEHKPAPRPTRIAKAVPVNRHAVLLHLWEIENTDTYTIKYGTSPGHYTNEKRAGTATTVSIEGLKEGETYFFAAYANNETGVSPASNEVRVTVDRPGAPVLEEVKASDGYLTIEWQSVPNAVGYKVEYGTVPGLYPTEIDSGNMISLRLHQLRNGQSYYFRVKAYNQLGDSMPSNERSGKPAAILPFAPNTVIARRVDGHAELTWKPSPVLSYYSNQAGPHLETEYDVYRSSSPQGEYELIASHVKATQYTDTNLAWDSGKEYYYYVKSINQHGESTHHSAIATLRK